MSNNLSDFDFYEKGRVKKNVLDTYKTILAFCVNNNLPFDGADEFIDSFQNETIKNLYEEMCTISHYTECAGEIFEVEFGNKVL